MHAIWDPSWFITMIVLAALQAGAILVTLISAAYWFFIGRKPQEGRYGPVYRDSSSGLVALGSLGVVLLIGIIGTIVAFPFSGQYHRYVPVTGTVQQVTSRFLSGDNGGTNQKFAVVLDGKTYGVNDTRASALHKGDNITILCERSWQWSGTPGWDCNWGRVNSAANGN